MPAQSTCVKALSATESLLATIADHAVSSHPLFAALSNGKKHNALALSALLRNYDAHACVLRRLLLKAATIMPEPAVGFVLENVRNEYGNGAYENNHQGQLRSLALALNITLPEYLELPVTAGVRRFIQNVGDFYFPGAHAPAGFSKAATAAGAITATEVMAIQEFIALQKAFTPFQLQNHIWFDHVSVEVSHSDDSLNLALFFMEEHSQSVLHGLRGVLDATVHLYDGLLASLTNQSGAGVL